MGDVGSDCIVSNHIAPAVPAISATSRSSGQVCDSVSGSETRSGCWCQPLVELSHPVSDCSIQHRVRLRGLDQDLNCPCFRIGVRLAVTTRSLVIHCSADWLSHDSSTSVKAPSLETWPVFHLRVMPTSAPPTVRSWTAEYRIVGAPCGIVFNSGVESAANQYIVCRYIKTTWLCISRIS